MKPGIICVVYVDDTIIGAQQLSDINREIMSLGIIDDTMQHTFSLRDEGDTNLKYWHQSSFNFHNPV
jgi:hypothetical protein